MGRLICERDVQSAAEGGRSLRVRHDQIVTPAARDLAARLGVRLEPEGEAAGGGPGPVLVAVGSDHGGYALKARLAPEIERMGFAVRDVGCGDESPVDYPVFAARVAELVSEGSAAFGIMIDGAGIGSAMVCNRFRGVRAALCYDLTTARNAREHNNANVLTLGGTLVGARLAKEIVESFLKTPFAGGRHQRRVAMIDALDC